MSGDYVRLKARIVTSGLEFPEGPVANADGSVLVCEIRGRRVTRVQADGRKETFCVTGGGPNGAAIGPDGALYICNNGGSSWQPRPWPFPDPQAISLLLPAGPLSDGPGPGIQRVAADGLELTQLFNRCGDIALRRPNDIVFDRHGGFWFTDSGGMSGRTRDITGVFYATADGTEIVEAIHPLEHPNGIGLSPDDRTLYVVETRSQRLWACELDGPGRVTSRRVLATIPADGLLGSGACDSLCIDAAGNIIVATIGSGSITIVAPDGSIVARVHVGDPITTNACFGGPDFDTLYVTAATHGQLLAFDKWPVPGLPLAYAN